MLISSLFNCTRDLISILPGLSRSQTHSTGVLPPRINCWKHAGANPIYAALQQLVGPAISWAIQMCFCTPPHPPTYLETNAPFSLILGWPAWHVLPMSAFTDPRTHCVECFTDVCFSHPRFTWVPTDLGTPPRKPAASVIRSSAAGWSVRPTEVPCSSPAETHTSETAVFTQMDTAPTFDQQEISDKLFFSLSITSGFGSHVP